ncbi:MAG: hypothetical protein BGP16_17915 [Sphingobium sp. 66-54]|nr:MAG: hypothetical protein BGP16_17915 [Sphingobium sp. 66-54]
MRRALPPLMLALAGLLLAPAAANAQAGKAPAPTKAEVERAASNLRVFMAALQSDKVPEVAKSALFACIYSNSFSKISAGTDKLLTEKKADRTDPNQVVAAMAAVCGVRPGEAPAKK